MKTIMRSALLAFAFTAFSANVAAQDQMGMGTWKLNVEKSKFSPGPAPKSITTKFEADGKGVKWSADRTDSAGKVTRSEYAGAYDGKEYPLKGSAVVDAVVLRKIDSHTTERINKKDGKVVTVETRKVAQDGKSYTTTVKGTTAKGEPIDIVMVFDKQ